jgi:hypothetical protein
MGVTISYRGSLADIGRVEDFEDRVLDLALEVGGHARVWRSVNDDDPRRVVRGVMLDLYPGQETTSLLISPEGWLINLFEIEDAEKGRLAEPPWCFVKTQFGPVEGHVALVEMLTALQREFFPNLEVSDEGGYWGIREPDEDASDDWLGDDERHPLLERVMDLNKRLYDLAEAAEGRQNENFRSLLGATGEMLGGLAQALGSRDFEPLSGLSLVQLKRALRGAAFAFGMPRSPPRSLPPLRRAGRKWGQKHENSGVPSSCPHFPANPVFPIAHRFDPSLLARQVSESWERDKRSSGTPPRPLPPCAAGE